MKIKSKNEVFDWRASGAVQCSHSDENDDATHDSLGDAFRWTPENTKLMLDLRFERQAMFQQRHHQKKKLWTEIAEMLMQQGYLNVTSEMCDLKYRNMLQTYKKNRLKDEQGLSSTIVWDYYELFKKAFKEMEDDAATVPSMLCESFCDETNPAADTSLPLEPVATFMPRDNGLLPQLVKIERADEEREPPVYKSRSFPQRRSMRVPKRPRRFSTLSNQSARAADCHPYVEDGNVSSHTDKELDSNTSVTASTQTCCNPAVCQLEKQEPTITPAWLTASEMQECKVFGESIGVQLQQVKEVRTRALLQLKMQELLFKAKIGALSMDQIDGE